MICKFCGKETGKDYDVCSECEKSLTSAINKNRRKKVKARIANSNRGITSLVCSVIAMTTPFGITASFICGVVAIVFGNLAKKTLGASLGKVGKTLGIVSLISCILKLILRLIGIACIVAISILAITSYILIKSFM